MLSKISPRLAASASRASAVGAARNHDLPNLRRHRRAPPAERNYSAGGSGPRDGGNPGRGTTTALVVGSSGALGSSVVHRFRENGVVSRIFGADVVPPPTPELRDALDGFVQLARPEEKDSPPDGGATSELLSMTVGLARGLEELDGDGGGGMIPLDAIVCAAGGFLATPDYASAEDYLAGVDAMLRQNLYPVLAASHVAAMRLNKGGLFVAIGAAAALAPTPGMLAYGISKCAVHHAVQTLGADRKGGQPSLLAGDPTASVVGILPTMLDTAANRSGAPEGTDFSTWTKTDDVADEVGRWVTMPDLRPHSGSLVKVHPDKKGGGAVFRLSR